jgi:hypothetical protein
VEQSTTCPHCGIIFEKYFKYHSAQKAKPQETEPPAIIIDNDEAEEHFLKQLLLNENRQTNSVYLIPRAIVFICLVIWSWRLISPSIESNAVAESFLHSVNLPFHEAGHIFFRPFGQFITSLGGTLGQLLMPLICMFTLLIKTRDPFGAAVAFWWFGENFLDMAPYINDARAGELPLLGGNFGHSSPYGFHDWEYLLTESGFIEYDHAIAKLAFAIGVMVMLLALFWSAVLLFKQYQNRD